MNESEKKLSQEEDRNNGVVDTANVLHAAPLTYYTAVTREFRDFLHKALACSDWPQIGPPHVQPPIRFKMQKLTQNTAQHPVSSTESALPLWRSVPSLAPPHHDVSYRTLPHRAVPYYIAVHYRTRPYSALRYGVVQQYIQHNSTPNRSVDKCAWQRLCTTIATHSGWR